MRKPRQETRFKLSLTQKSRILNLENNIISLHLKKPKCMNLVRH